MCPLHLLIHTVATLPWEVQKSYYSTIFNIVILHFNGHFPDEPGLAGVFLKQSMMEVVVTTRLLEL